MIPNGGEQFGVQATRLLLGFFTSTLIPPALIQWLGRFAHDTKEPSCRTQGLYRKPKAEQGISQGMGHRIGGLGSEVPLHGTLKVRASVFHTWKEEWGA